MVGKKGDSMLQYQVKHYKGSRESLARYFVARYSIIHWKGSLKLRKNSIFKKLMNQRLIKLTKLHLQKIFFRKILTSILKTFVNKSKKNSS